MLSRKGFPGRSLLSLAAFIGDKDTFEAVLAAIGTRMDTQKVWRRRLFCGIELFIFNIPPLFIAWKIAVVIFPSVIHLMVETF